MWVCLALTWRRIFNVWIFLVNTSSPPSPLSFEFPLLDDSKSDVPKNVKGVDADAHGIDIFGADGAIDM